MKHLYPFYSKVRPEQRKDMMQQEPWLIWLTGLSGSGKSTLAVGLEHYLFQKGYKVYLLDGDNMRSGLNSDLGFTRQDRKENVRRVSEVAKLMLDAGLVVIGAFISPYEVERALVRETVGSDRYTEVYINCPLQVCEQRDVKGLYDKAQRGLIPAFTGVSAPYEVPAAPDVIVKTAEESVEDSLRKLIEVVEPLLVKQQQVKHKPDVRGMGITGAAS
ncbi:adenylyl-sulfate kinase [Pontibacter saemangeumensis]|uniref:Adenylyl-sulfate kinase n=1 Tax=Pontibacter saemangeumensis TaxID=1084525 RepID=A0ABP8LK23_9BACT